jgi:hypothetical protein
MLLAMLVAAAWLATFPVQRAALGLCLLAATALVAWRPWRLWTVLPVAMSLMALAPWSGRLYLDEFDVLLGLSICAAWWRQGPPPPVRADAWLRAAMTAVLVSLGVGALQAAASAAGSTAWDVPSYLGPHNALRILRGALWALLLWRTAERQRAAGWPVQAALGQGMVLALAAVTACILLERAAFSNLLDLADTYRVAGPFPAMHLGGAYVECFVACTLPFLVAAIMARPTPARIVPGALLLAVGCYALTLTYSRAGILAGALATVAAIVMTQRLRLRSAGHLSRRPGRVAVAAGLAALVLGTVAAVWFGAFGQERQQQVDRDLALRRDHWAQSLKLVPEGWGPTLTGLGLGRFPALKLLSESPAERSATAELSSAGGAPFLRLGSGRPLYLEQAVALPSPATAPYTVRARLRAPTGGTGQLGVWLCEKWLVASARCSRAHITVSGTGWAELAVALEPLPQHQPGTVPRPLKFGFNLDGSQPLELSGIALLGPDGGALTANGDFHQGMDHWFFGSDHHLGWHAKSLPLAVLLELGLMGVLAFGSLVALALRRSQQALRRGDVQRVPVLCALGAFLAIGLVDSLIDEPRFLLLLLLLCSFAAAPPAGNADAGRGNGAPADG